MSCPVYEIVWWGLQEGIELLVWVLHTLRWIFNRSTGVSQSRSELWPSFLLIFADIWDSGFVILSILFLRLHTHTHTNKVTHAHMQRSSCVPIIYFRIGLRCWRGITQHQPAFPWINPSLLWVYAAESCKQAMTSCEDHNFVSLTLWPHKFLPTLFFPRQ